MYHHITAIITPAPGKLARLQEVLNSMAAEVHKHEEGTLRYLMTTEVESKQPRIVVIEQYKDKDAADAHTRTEYFKKLIPIFAKERLTAAKSILVHSSSTGGYDSDRELIKPKL